MPGEEIHFRLAVLLRDIEVGPQPEEEIRFQRDDLELSFARRLDNKGRFTDDLALVACVSREVSNEIAEEMTSYVAQIATQPPPTPLGDDETFAGVEIFSGPAAMWLMAPPEAVVRLCVDIEDELAAAVARLVGILRWLFNRPFPAHPLASARFEWSLDRENWLNRPGGLTDAEYIGSTGPVLEQQAFAAIWELWSSEMPGEPLARQVLLEANELMGENPRAAVVLCVAAAEIGVKQYAALHSSSGQSEAWLLESIQSPPLERLLTKYLVFFTDKRTRTGAVIPKRLVKSITDAVEARNRLVHRGHEPPSEELVASMLLGVNDLLYLLDWFSGQEWALGHVSKEVREEYPSPNDGADATT